ncbi:MAG: alcohol dehydrogenase catalytic domain-containing protein, partial [Actinomycetota bacterium]|nr:alcohol dehydrogenase catalytic domain-containing protein [Actinomycetota bacterium]
VEPGMREVGLRVAMYYNNRDVRLEELPVPEIGPGEILMKVEAAGVCGTDVLEWYRIHKAPLVLGHEVAGTVAAIGEDVMGYQVSDRIAAAHHVSCNTCHWCLGGHETVCETLRATNFHPGGFAEYVRLPAINVDRGIFRLPDDVSFEEATFIEPLACVYRGQRLSRLKPGQTVLVIGSGMSGLLHVQLAAALGAGLVVAVDVVEYKLEAAMRLGANLALDAAEDIPDRLRKINDGRLADLVIVCAGAASAVPQALASVERGGTILFFAATRDAVKIETPVNDLFWRNEITLLSTYAGSRADHVAALELIEMGRVPVADMITHRLALAETQEGFRLAAESTESNKVIIEPHR